MTLIKYIHDLSEVIVPQVDAPDVIAAKGEPIEVPDELAAELIASDAWVAVGDAPAVPVPVDAAPAAPTDAVPVDAAPAAPTDAVPVDAAPVAPTDAVPADAAPAAPTDAAPAADASAADAAPNNTDTKGKN